MRVWMVEDGKRLFVDKNANGDLTDDGPAIEPTDVRDLGQGRWDYDYVSDPIGPTNGPQTTRFKLARWNYADKEDSYGLSLMVDDRLPMYAGWFGTFWSTNIETAPVLHFSGPFTPKLLRLNAFTNGVKPLRLSLAFINPGSGMGTQTRVSIAAFPHYLMPVVTIDWPVPEGTVPLRTKHELSERCCYWEYYTSTFDVPKGVVPGRAKLTVDFPATITQIVLATNAIVVPVMGR